jgi:methyl-accepting chemotaxis protein
VIENNVRQLLLPKNPGASARQEEALARLHEAMDTAIAALNRMEATSFREMNAERTQAYRIAWRTLAWMAAAAGLSVAGGVVLALVFSWRINRPLAALAAGSHRVAEGDLTARVSVEGGSELRRTASAFNYMAEQLAASKQVLADQIRNLEEALGQVKQLKGLLPICAWCRQVRNDRGYWSSVEEYVQEHTEAEFSHGICPSCRERL